MRRVIDQGKSQAQLRAEYHATHDWAGRDEAEQEAHWEWLAEERERKRQSIQARIDAFRRANPCDAWLRPMLVDEAIVPGQRRIRDYGADRHDESEYTIQEPTPDYSHD